MHKSLKNYKVLCCLEDEILICSYRNKLFKINEESGEILSQLSLHLSNTHKLLSFSKKYTRFFRLDVFSVCVYRDLCFVSFRNIIYEIRIKDFRIINTFSDFNGSKPLYMTAVEGVVGFDDGVYFGDYFFNKSKKESSIFRISKSKLKKVYTFKSGLIEHTHNIICDPKRSCIYIFTGDFGDSAAIWKASNNFDLIVPLVRGDQLYRACFGFVNNDHLIYFTDSQFTANYMMRLFLNDEPNYKSEKLAQINGPCIYGTMVNGKCLISTSCEPGFEKLNIFNIWSNKPGFGVILNFVKIYLVNPENLSIREISKFEKDCLSMTLFQFGNAFFPINNRNADYTYTYTIAVNNFDLATTKIDIKHE